MHPFFIQKHVVNTYYVPRSTLDAGHTIEGKASKLCWAKSVKANAESFKRALDLV